METECYCNEHEGFCGVCQLAQEQELEMYKKLAPVRKHQTPQYICWFFENRYMNGGELAKRLLELGWTDDQCRKFYKDNSADWDD
jgi:hypothetical protein